MSAVLVATSAFQGLSYMIVPLLGVSVDFGFVLMFLLVTIVPLIAASFLWAKAEQISHIPFAPQLSSSIREFDTQELVNIGIHLIGIYVLAFGVIAMTGTESLALAQTMWAEEFDSISDSLAARTWSSRVAYIVQIALGYYLLRRGKARLGV